MITVFETPDEIHRWCNDFRQRLRDETFDQCEIECEYDPGNGRVLWSATKDAAVKTGDFTARIGGYLVVPTPADCNRVVFDVQQWINRLE